MGSKKGNIVEFPKQFKDKLPKKEWAWTSFEVLYRDDNEEDIVAFIFTNLDGSKDFYMVDEKGELIKGNAKKFSRQYD